MPVLGTIFVVSGFAAIVYQVAWVRELGLLFGSTAQAAAMTIAIFFTGLASGGWFWGRRAARLRDPLRTFGLVEVGVGVTALGYFLLVDLYVAAYPAIFAAVGDSAALDTLAKAVIAALVLLPSSFLMGGTLPLLAQHLIREREHLGRTGSVLYALNTFGSAAGAIAAGFVLPLALGFRNAYLLAIGLDVAVGITAITIAGLARRRGEAAPVASGGADPGPEGVADPREPRRPGEVPLRLVWVIAALSGVTTLAVEVVWTRLFAQVLQNSAYTYALVLGTFLVALALGAVVANGLARLERVSSVHIVGALLAACGAVTAASPWLFFRVTDGLTLLGAQADFAGYVWAVVSVAAVVMLMPGIVLGALLPTLLRTLQQRRRAAGDTIGRLVAVNTVGGIVGSLLAGFVLLPVLGAWRSLLVLAAVYPWLLAATLWSTRRDDAPARAGRTSGRGRRATSAPPARVAVVAASVVLGAVALVISPSSLDVVRLPADGSQQLVEVIEGTQATTSVIADRDDLFLRVNNFYTLGGTRAYNAERDQSALPLLLHPDPREVFYLGMGTGITAGAGLAHEPDRMVVCELIGDVVTLAERHFGPWTDALFTDDRVEILAEDGRTCLARTDDRYDLIISDLFTPWEAGTGNLYTREHYEITRDSLAEGGMMVQWVPLFQASDTELGIIARTMDEVFDEVTAWRGDFFAERSVVALIGRMDPEPFDPATPVRQGRALTGESLPDAFFEALVLRHYLGNISAGGHYADRDVNTDARPLIEFIAPRTQRAARAGEATFLTGIAREVLYDELIEAIDLADDPFLARLDERQRGYVLAGRSYSAFRLLNARGEDADHLLDDFLERSPPEASGVGDLSPARRLLDPIVVPAPRP